MRETICLLHWLAALSNLPRVALARRVDELSRNRTYIRNLEGFCPDPLDDEPVNSCKAISCYLAW